MEQVLALVVSVQLVILTLVSFTFCFLYQIRTGGTWRRLPEGRHLMRFTAMLGITFALTLAFSFMVPNVISLRVALIAEAVVFGALIVEIANRLRLLLQNNHNQGLGEK